MLDPEFVRLNADLVRQSLIRRHDLIKEKLLAEWLSVDVGWRKTKLELDTARSFKNSLTDKIKEAKMSGSSIDVLLKEAKLLPEKIKLLELEETELKEKSQTILSGLPNVLHDSVPFGKDDSENIQVRTVGEIPKFDFEIQHHGQLAEKNGWADFTDAANISGAGFYFLKGDLALLEQAVLRFALDELVKQGFSLILPPFMLHRKPYEGVTDLQDFENVMYKIEGMDLYLIATSEHSIASMHMNRIFEAKDLPLLYCGLSACFRKEIGKHSIDERGLFRVHQFSKVEQFVFCSPSESWEWHEKILSNAESILKKLEIPYRVVNVCTGDIGVVAAKKYDLEGWSAREKKYIELVSCSNCTSYQAVGLNIKHRSGQEKEFVHTLNSTAIATPRALRILLENNQTQKGTVRIPKVLHPYMNGLKELVPKNRL
ncbi:MAG: serine--tRNA ligase [Candidatus Diapherotrites archaeon]|nr:serine--tRNA ligase [Candidatus Diapherotrites archaeon]